MTTVSLAAHAKAELHRHGFVIIPDFLDAAQVAACRENMRRYYPTREEFFAAAPARYSWLTQGLTAGILPFPFLDDALNDAITGPHVVGLVRDVLGETDVRMVGCSTWAKYASNFDYEQEFHLDFPNNTLVVPRERDRFGKLEFFIYLSDITEETGPTYVLSHDHTRHLVKEVWHLPRDKYGDVYEHEIAATGPAGTLLIYTLDTFHRGSRFTSPEAYRWLLGASYRAAGVDWIGRAAWPYYGGSPAMNHFITRATVDQRSMIGFPQPGDAYWNEETLDGVGIRYPGMDLEPYRQALTPR